MKFPACRLDPLLEFSYDGLSVHPYEVMFVPMSTVAIENGWSFARLAAQYETWSALQVLPFEHNAFLRLRFGF